MFWSVFASLSLVVAKGCCLLAPRYLTGGNGGTAGNLVDGATNALVEQVINIHG